jgi:hypothetical protein
MIERPAPGEVPQRRLERPPGDRYLPPDVADPPAQHPDIVRATLLGAGAALLTAVLASAFNAGLNLLVGVAVVAALGGWLIGRAVRYGAWSGRAHVSSPAPLVLAVLLALAAWLVGEVLAYLLSLAALPDSVRTFPERIANLSFLDWLSPQFGTLEIISLFLLGGLAWFSSR